MAFTSTPVPRLSLARLPTPLQALQRLTVAGGPRIWVKRDDLSDCALSGNKLRKLEFTLAAVLEAGCDTVITCGGLQSNHCRATALACARLGLHCHLVLRGDPQGDADGNLLLDQLAGASISCYPPAEYQRDLDVLLQHRQQHFTDQGQQAFIIPTGASDAIGVWGYVEACAELRQDFDAAGIRPRHIICATGSGGTQAGLTAGSVLYGLDAQVWGINVCDDEQWFLNKVARDLRDWQQRYQIELDVASLPVKVIDGYVGPGYARATDEVMHCIADVARQEGLILDPVYTGKAFHGMLEEIRRGRFSDSDDIIFIHTGGIFGIFPQREGFAFLGEK